MPKYSASDTAPVLRDLPYEDGWFGLVSTWQTANPQIRPVRGFTGDPADTVWLPSENLARIWRSFVSYRPRTVLLWPFSEGIEWEGAPEGYNCMLEAGKPFWLLAMGPLAPGLEVKYFSGKRPLRVLRGSDYLVELEGLEPGWHVLYAETTINGQTEVSRPVGILFQNRADATAGR